MPDLQTLLSKFLVQLYAGNVSYTGQVLGGDGTAALPAYSFTSEPTLGFRRNSAGVVGLEGALATSGPINSGGNINSGGGIQLPNASTFFWATRTLLSSAADGHLAITINGATIGSRLKVDALPTIASGFGGSPAVIAGSTPFAGAVDVGTGGSATSGVINFNGTAFPSAPFVVVTNKTSNTVVRAVATTTQLTISSTTAWGASDVVAWIAISPK